MMVMVMAAAADRLREVGNVRQLPVLRSGGEVSGKLVELACRRGVTLRLRGLRSLLQVSGDLLRDLLVLRRVRLLKLLERAQHLGKGRELGGVGLP